MSFLVELKRRNILRVAVLYVVAAWLVLQVSDVTISLLELPSGTGRLIFILLALGFPAVLVFSWFYEITSGGIKPEKEVDRSKSITHETGKRLTVLTAILLVLSVVAIAVNQVIDRKLDSSVDQVVSGSESDNGSLAASPLEHSVAVLPFLDRSEDADHGYLADGIAEDILNFLAQVPEMHVIARTSSFAFKGKDASVEAIATALNVGHVLEGSVRLTDDNVRITAQLVQANTGYQLWSEHYDRRLTDIHKIQTEVAAAVARALKVALLEPPPPIEVDPEAYRLLLQARAKARLRTLEGLRKSEEFLNQALEIDPFYVAAIQQLASTYLSLAARMLIPQEEGFNTARREYEKALELDPDSLDAECGLGLIDVMHGQYSSAATRIETVLSESPLSLKALRATATLLKYVGRYAEAAEIEFYVISRDPISGISRNNLGFTLIRLDRYKEAENQLRTSQGFSPDDLLGHWLLGESILLQGDAQLALVEFDQSDPTSMLQGRAMAYHDLGRYEDSSETIAKLITRASDVEPSAVAFAFAYRGDVDLAFEWFEKEYELSGPGAWYAEWKDDPLLKKLHDDPRWEAMFERVGISGSQLAEIEFDIRFPGEART